MMSNNAGSRSPGDSGSLRPLLDDGPWPAWERAAQRLPARLLAADPPGCRQLLARGLPQPVAVTLDLALAHLEWRYSLRHLSAVDDGTLVRLAGLGSDLKLARFALAHEGLVLLAQTPAEAGDDALAAIARLVLADITRASLLCQQPGAASPISAPAAVLRPEARAPGEAISQWQRGEALAAEWQCLPQPQGWHLLRQPWADAALPPACRLLLQADTLSAECDIVLPGVPDADSRQALALFLLRHNAVLPARGIPLSGSPLVRISAGIPLPGLQATDVSGAVSALAATYDATRREVAALCDPAVSRMYLRLKPAHTQGTS